MTARAVLCLGLALVVIGCGSPEPTPSDATGATVTRPAATPSASATIEAHASETAEPTSPGAIMVSGVAQVVTTDLVMRSAPGGGTDSVVYPGVLDAPTLLFVVAGPTTVSGYEWYLVYPFAFETKASQPPEQWRLSWVAAGSRDGEPWIAPATLDCPQPDLEKLIEMSAMASLACFGDAQMTLEGSYGGCSYVVPGVITPSWLGSAVCFLRPLGTPPDASFAEPFLAFHIPSDLAGDIPELAYESGTNLRLSGHFDDPAALTCVAGPFPAPSGFEPTPAPPGDESLAAGAVVLACRAHFVVTESAPVDP